MPVSTPHRNLIWDHLAPSSLWSCFFFWIYFFPPKYTHTCSHSHKLPFACSILQAVLFLFHVAKFFAVCVHSSAIHTPYTQVSNWQILTRPVTTGLPVIIDANRAELGFCLGVVLLKTVMWKYDWSLFSRSHTASLSHTVKHRLLHSVPPSRTHTHICIR